MEEAKPDKAGSQLILIYSQRERIRKILTAGLMQANFMVIQADSLYTAGVKVNQYIPDVIILDITKSNIRDLLFLERLQKSVRTRGVSILVSVTGEVHKGIDKAHNLVVGDTSGGKMKAESNVHIIEYPFHFADLLKEINTIMLHKKRKRALQKKADMEPNRALGDKLFDFKVNVQTKLSKIESSLQHKWAFPYTVIKALDVIGSESVGCKELGKCIETDLAAATSIIRVANAVYYAKRQGRVSDVTDAVVRIGFHETRSLLACLALIDLSPELYKRYGFTRHEFWMHCLATAIIAEKLCNNCNYERPELAFVSGLIHDLGKIPLDNNFEQVFPHLLEHATSKVIPFFEAEQYLMGFTHADLAHYLTTMWNFPEGIALALLHHHDPEKIMNTRGKKDRILQESVYVANIFAKAINLGHSCDEVLGEIPNGMLVELKIPVGPEKKFFDSVLRPLKLFIDYLNLPKKDLLITKPCPVRRSNDFTVIYGEKVHFHPIVLALENRGYCVKVAKNVTAKMDKETKIAIFIPDKGSPLDITLKSEEEEIAGEAPYLKVFLLENIDSKKSAMEFKKGDIILLDRHALDMRLLIHAFDHYLEKVVIPEQESVDDIINPASEDS